MKTLKDLLKDTPVTALHGDGSTTVAALAYDSRAVTRSDCFFATRGTQSDGHDFIPDAVAKGASAVVCEQLPAETAHGVAYVVVPDAAGALADMAAAFYGHPSRELKLVGITGTNGKTTTATLLYDLVRALGYKAGLVSTVVYKVGERIVEATHTTPDPVRLNAMMREMADEGCEYCFMECSSHAIVQQRTRGLHFAGGIFSNITHDHLDYHKTFAEYIRAKKLFFDSLAKDAFALTNADDKNGRVMVQNTAAGVHTYSLRTMADFRCKIVEMHVDGMLLRIDGQDGLVLDSLSQSGIVLPEEALLRRLSRLFGAPPDQRSMQALFQEILAADEPLFRELRLNGLAMPLPEDRAELKTGSFEWLSNRPARYRINLSGPRFCKATALPCPVWTPYDWTPTFPSRSRVRTAFWKRAWSRPRIWAICATAC